jgi:hypothetical protein
MNNATYIGLIKCRALIRIDVQMLPTTDLLFQPKMQAMLSTLTSMCWPVSFSGMRRNGGMTPIISDVAVQKTLPSWLFPESILFFG